MSTAIEWTDATWNPVTGCTKVSPGCANCYALTMAKRLKAMGNPRYQKDGGPGSGPGFGVSLHPDVLTEPLRWRKARRVFVVSMGDLFHGDVPSPFIADVFAVMATAHQHTFQVLTKRPERMRELLTLDAFRSFVDKRCREQGVNELFIQWSLPNIWLGVSVENQRMADERIPLLLETPAAVRFLSCEPLLGPLDLQRWINLPLRSRPIQGTPPLPWNRMPGIDWVIVGGESGPGRAERKLVEPCHCRTAYAKPTTCSCCQFNGWRAKPKTLEWLRSIRDQCQAAGVAYFLKQLGGPRPTSGGRLLDGREHNEMPQREAMPT